MSGSKAAQDTPPASVDAAFAKGTPTPKLVDQIETLLAKRRKAHVKLTPRRFAPLGSVLASIALAVYAIPRLWNSPAR